MLAALPVAALALLAAPVSAAPVILAGSFSASERPGWHPE